LEAAFQAFVALALLSSTEQKCFRLDPTRQNVIPLGLRLARIRGGLAGQPRLSFELSLAVPIGISAGFFVAADAHDIPLSCEVRPGIANVNDLPASSAVYVHHSSFPVFLEILSWARPVLLLPSISAQRAKDFTILRDSIFIITNR
jgi:hypothetical protein